MHTLDWNATIDSIKEVLPTAQFQNWFKPLEFIRSDESRVVLGVPSRFHEEWVRNNFSSQIKQAIRKQTGTEVQLEFEILIQEENIEASRATIPTANLPARPALRIVSPATQEPATQEPETPQLPAFGHPFIELDYCRVASQCSAMFASGKDFKINPLILQGGVGMGKTHLLTDIGRRIHRENPYARIRYVTFETFTAEMVRALKSNDTLAFKRKYREETDVLLFDDVQGLTRRLKTQEELLHIFNEIVARGGRVAFTSSLPPHRLEEFIEPLRSRILSGLVAEIRYPTFEEKVEILSRMSAQNGMAIEGPVLRSMADKGQNDVRELIGSLLRVHLQAKLENRPLDNTFIAREGWVRETQREVITMAEIVSLVEHNFGVPRSELMSKSRKGATNWARQVAMYLARKYTLLPLEEIGKTFGRDHATVIHSFQKVSETIETQPTRRYEVDFLKQKLEARSPRQENLPEPTFPHSPVEIPFPEPSLDTPSFRPEPMVNPSTFEIEPGGEDGLV